MLTVYLLPNAHKRDKLLSCFVPGSDVTTFVDNPTLPHTKIVENHRLILPHDTGTLENFDRLNNDRTTTPHQVSRGILI